MLVSVTIPVYNNLEGLKKSLKSVLSQTYANWEAIVVDDGSKENHKKIVDEFNDSRIRFYRLEKNRGRPIARQKTFEMMRGEYCAFLDAGDCYEKDFVKNAISFFTDDDLLAVSQTMKIIYKNQEYYTYYKEGIIDVKSPIYQRIGFASTIFKASICKNYIFNPALKYSQDRHFLNFISNHNSGKIRLTNTKGYIYNQGDEMKVSITFKKYYYDGLRLFKEKQYLNSILSFFKAISMTIIHFIFGYEKLLKIRFKKNKI